MKKILSLILLAAMLFPTIGLPARSAETVPGDASDLILYESFDTCAIGSYRGDVIKPEKSSSVKVVEENGNQLSQIAVTSEVGKAAGEVFGTGFLDFSEDTVFSFDVRNAASSKGSLKAELRPSNGVSHIISLVSLKDSKITYLPNTGSAYTEEIADTETASVSVTFNSTSGTLCAYRGGKLKTKVEDYRVSVPSLKDFNSSSCIFRFQLSAHETPEGEDAYTAEGYVDNVFISHNLSKTEELYVSCPTLFYDTTLTGEGISTELYPVSSARDGYNIGRILLVNGGTNALNIRLFMTHKSEGILKKLSVSEAITLFPDTSDTINAWAELTDVKPGDVLEFYLFDSLSGITPLCVKIFAQKPLDVEAPLNSELIYLFDKNGKNTHPRVMATEEDFARIKSDESLTEWKTSVIEKADKILGYDTSVHIRYETYGDAFLFMAQRMLDYMQHLGMAYQLTGLKTYANKAYDFMERAASFADWNPSHFLSTAEMTAAYAIAYDWMYHGFGKGQRQDIEDWVYKNGLLAGMAAYNGTGGDENTGWWRFVSHNWNVVCNGGLITGAVAFADIYPEVSFEIIENAVDSIKRPLKNFAPDGAWFEGYSYLEFMLQAMSRAIPSLELSFGTDFAIMNSEGLSKSGDFLIQMSGNKYVNNFHDAGASVPDTPELMWLAGVYGKSAYGKARINSVNKYDNILPVPTDLLFYNKNYHDAQSNLPLSDYFRGTEYVSLRSSWDDDALYISYHGGKADVNHGHADCGTFVLDALGERWASDLGAEGYNNDGYFGDKRYLYYRARAEGHNTLVINPDTSSGQDMDADTLVESNDFEADNPSSTLNLTSAYASKAESVKRTFSLAESGTKAIVSDEIKLLDASSEVYWFMHTLADVSIESNNLATLSIGDKKLRVSFEVTGGNAELVCAKAEPFEDLGVVQNTANSDYKKLQLKVSGTDETVIKVSFVPVTHQ